MTENPEGSLAIAMYVVRFSMIIQTLSFHAVMKNGGSSRQATRGIQDFIRLMGDNCEFFNRFTS